MLGRNVGLRLVRSPIFLEISLFAGNADLLSRDKQREGPPP